MVEVGRITATALLHSGENQMQKLRAAFSGSQMSTTEPLSGSVAMNAF